MDLVQRKLAKNEWEGIEIPLPSEEIDVLRLIIAGYNDVNFKTNKKYFLNVHKKVVH